MKYFLAVIWIWLFLFSFSHAATFNDTAGHEYRESIEYLANHWVVNGYADGGYGPDRDVTRSEIMKIILESSLDSELPLETGCFPDVDNERFSKYVCYAKKRAMVKWYSDGRFKPGQQVTVAEALKMWLEWFDTSMSAVNGDWYEKYFNFVHTNDIFSKYWLLPNIYMTRWEMAYLIHQLMLEKAWSIVFDSSRDVTSNGCGKAPPSTAPTSSVINGLNRHYITDIGSNYNKDVPMRLIFAFHGRTNPNSQVKTYYDLDEVSNGNAIVIYPLGLPEWGPSRSWSNPGDRSYALRDFALFDQLLEEFSENYCIDKDQIFAVWHSLGAWFTNSLSCARWDVIRGTVAVGWGTTYNNCNGPVAGIVMQNPDDNLSPLSSAIRARDQMVEQNGCSLETKKYWSQGNCVEYTNCQTDAPTIWCPYTESYRNWKYYPHKRPDYAGQLIRDFFNSLD